MPSNRASARRPTRTLTILAGVNGAGKSSVGGTNLRRAGAKYFNPDEYAREFRARASVGLEKSNAVAWAYGKAQLEKAIADSADFSFETTLGGKSITDLLIRAATTSHNLDIWFVGLASIELHLHRVARRVEKGGHPIPEADIRRRWIGSHENIIRLIPHVRTLRVFDNSAEKTAEHEADPELLLALEDRDLVHPGPEKLTTIPKWAKPIVAAAYIHFGLRVSD